MFVCLSVDGMDVQLFALVGLKSDNERTSFAKKGLYSDLVAICVLIAQLF